MTRVGRFRFPRTCRLPGSVEFGRVFDGRCSVANKNFTVYALANDLQFPRLGLVVGKKAARRATDRNRIKRAVRETFRQLAPDLAKLDIVVMARAPAASQSGHNLMNGLTILFSRVEKKCAKPCRN